MQTAITALFTGWLVSYLVLRSVSDAYERSGHADRARRLATIGVESEKPIGVSVAVAVSRLVSWVCFLSLVVLLMWRIAGRL